jgi:hypothetical protein
MGRTGQNETLPSSRFDELVALADEHDGQVIAEQARSAGFIDSVRAPSSSETESNESPEEFTAFPIFRPAGSRNTEKPLSPGDRTAHKLHAFPLIGPKVQASRAHFAT